MSGNLGGGNAVGSSSSSQAVVEEGKAPAREPRPPPVPPSRQDEEFLINLYPAGVDRERSYSLAEATGKPPVVTYRSVGAMKREAAARERAEIRERERREAAAAKASAKAKEKEAVRAAAVERKAQREASQREARSAKEDARIKEAVGNLLNAMIVRLETEEKRGRKEADSKNAKEARAMSQKERKREHDAKRDRDEEKRLRQIKKLKALDARRLISMRLMVVRSGAAGSNAPVAAATSTSSAVPDWCGAASAAAASSSSSSCSSMTLAAAASGEVRVRVHLSINSPSSIPVPIEGGREVVPAPIGNGFLRLCSEYDPDSRNLPLDKFHKNHRWHLLIDGIELTVQSALGSSIVVKSSIGCGKWARVPWLSMNAPNESTQQGLYLQYLMRADSTGFYLCLCHGTTRLRAAAGPVAANTHMARVGSYIRERCSRLLGPECVARFDLGGAIELRAPKGHGAPYEKTVVICRFYARTAIPNEAELIDDVRRLAAAYTHILQEPIYAGHAKAANDLASQAALQNLQQQKEAAAASAAAAAACAANAPTAARGSSGIPAVDAAISAAQRQVGGPAYALPLVPPPPRRFDLRERRKRAHPLYLQVWRHYLLISSSSSSRPLKRILRRWFEAVRTPPGRRRRLQSMAAAAGLADCIQDTTAAAGTTTAAAADGKRFDRPDARDASPRVTQMGRVRRRALRCRKQSP